MLPQTRSLTLGAPIGAPTVREGLPPIAHHHTVTALVFLEGCGIDTSRLPEQQTYEAMIKIAVHEMGRSDLAAYFRSMLSRTPEG